MGFQINTNIASLQAQEYLRTNSEFQHKTINRVTSGLRIVASGDDAAGLAIANGFRSDVAVLTQGIRNANDGLSTLQTIDGGINNISKLLDRARSLATQSASGTFQGSRSVLDSEFKSVISEIDRQAQAIGLDKGGAFAKNLSVFIGGGRANNGTSVTQNGAVGVDLRNSTVDAKSLGLKGVQAVGNTSIDIGTGSTTTSVAHILADTTNLGTTTGGFTDFYFRGPGFGDGDRVKVSVNMNGVTDTSTLVAAINSAIEAAGNGVSAAATAFKNAGIQASVNTHSDGTQQLAFSSSTAAFQVSAGDRMANALMGNTTGAGNPTGKALENTVTGHAATAAGATTFGAAGAGNIMIRVQGGGLQDAVDLKLEVVAGTTVDQALTSLGTLVSQNSALQAAGITLQTATAGSALVFANSRGERFEVMAAGDVQDRLGLGSYRLATSSSGQFDYTAVTGSGATFAAGTTQDLEFSLAGGSKVAVNIAAGQAGTAAAAVNALNAAFSQSAALQAAGLVATTDGTDLTITSSNGTAFRINALAAGAVNQLGFGNTGIAAAANAQSALTASATFNSGGASQTDVLGFTAIRNGSDDQTITISANDANGSAQSLAVVLRNDGTARNAGSLDEAINAINIALQSSNNATLSQIVAVKEQNLGAEGIRFVSTLSNFKVGVGTTGSGAGVGEQGKVLNSGVSAGGSTAGIASQEAAEKAVSNLAQAVTTLGEAQAVVGKGQNQFNYAVNLAQSQLTNVAAAESRIRDADLATEAANLTKAQVLLQAGIAALAQANSAPQAVLALLRG